MSKEGQGHAAELKRLEDRRKELEDALMRLARDEADAEEIMELATIVEQLEGQVETARAAASMEKNMTKNERDLVRLGERRQKLLDALRDAADDEADAMYDALADRLNLPKIDVPRTDWKRPATAMEKSVRDVRKAAAVSRETAERQLDQLAKQMQQTGESFHKAYDRALDSDMGRSLMQVRDDAAALEVGGITSMDIEEARKSLAR